MVLGELLALFEGDGTGQALNHGLIAPKVPALDVEI